MSTIESLSIQGIRSFGVRAEDKQAITFSSPVTLILGTNGSGKTTIIECLKYALTGETPPGSSRGQTFIHDPKIFDFSECLGQVKLLVRNIRDERVTVTRSMKISHKRGKLAFETLDATINFESQTQKDTISKRCVDVDAEMCQFMGVSKAIINNVIFCHQEDSCWPLDEPKKLKEKFDAIFGTTEYNKAIDRIIKMRKEQSDELKIKEGNLRYLDHIKKDAENKSLDLENAQKKLEKLQQSCSNYESEMKPIEERLSHIYKIEAEMGQLQAQKIEYATKLKHCQEQVSNLSSKIKTIFEGNIHLLDKEIRNFNTKMQEKHSELNNLEDMLQSIKNEEKKIQSTLTDLDRKKTSLIHQRQQEQEYIAERAAKVYELCSSLKITVNGDIEHSCEGIDDILKSIKNSLLLEQKKITNTSNDHEKQDQEKQKEIDKLREKKASVESDIASKRNQKAQTERDLKKLESEIKAVETAAQTLSNLTQEIEKIDKVYQNLSETSNLEETKKEIAEKRKTIHTLQDKLEKTDEQLTFLNSISKLVAEISLKEKEYEKREQEVRRVKNKHSDNLKKIFPNRTIDSNYKRNVQKAFEDLQRQIKQLNTEINNKKLKEKELQMTRKNQRVKLTKSEKELEDCQDKIFDKCHSTPYEELLAKCKENIQKLQLDHGAFTSAEAMYKKYIQKIEDDPCCPLCHTKMSQNEASDLTGELSDEIHRLPENIERTKKELNKEQTKYENLLSLKPIIERRESLEKDIPKLKTELKQTEEKLAAAASDVESLQVSTAEPAVIMDLASSMLGDMSLLDEALKDVARIQADLEKLKAKLPEGSSSASIEDVQLEKTTVAAELKNCRSEVDLLQTKYEKESEILNKLREKRNSLKDKQIKLQEGVQALSQLKTRSEELSQQVSTVSTEINHLQQELRPLQNQLTSAIEEKQQSKEENRKVLNGMVSKLDGLKKINNDIERYTKELNELSRLNLVSSIEQLKTKVQKATEEQTSKSKANEETTKAIEKIKTEIFNHETLERDLKDNRELKLIQKKQEDLQEEFEELKKNMGEVNYRSLTREKEDLKNKRDEMTVKKGELLGQMGEINNQVNKLRGELNDPKFKDSTKNYRKSYYDVEIMKKIIYDLGQYRVALEWALMKFHSEKMERINRFIREFWRQIYRGNDIDFIQIQTDEMKTDGSEKRRNYNYRVVQSKNRSIIDMRGRCSAGQRVLASLIIRMALAETFSSNCSVLALDEPTTNLDRINILSLCEALNRIVEERQAHSNFMLVIITHDEEFISTLGRIRTYHKVFRNDDGKSVIRKVRVA